MLALGTTSCPVEDTTCQRDGNVIVVASFLVAGGSIFNLWELQTPSFCDVVAQASDTPVPLHRQNRERNLASWRKISHRGQFHQWKDGSSSWVNLADLKESHPIEVAKYAKFLALTMNQLAGVVHAWVGQKHLNCYIFKCFSYRSSLASFHLSNA